MIIWPVRWNLLRITMTPKVAQQILNDFTPEEQKVLEEAAKVLVQAIKDNGGYVY